MGSIVFLLCYLLVAGLIGFFGAQTVRLWVRVAAVGVAASLPVLLWLMLGVRDAVRFGYPVFERVTESGRFWFYAGSGLALTATPVWLLVGLCGLWIGARKRKRNLC